MNRWLLPLVVSFVACFALRAEEPVNWEPVAKQLQAATVTVRVCTRDCAKPEGNHDKEPLPEKAAKKEDGEAPVARPQVSVCSGFFVTEKLLITAINAGTDSSIRLTYTDGTQACGALQVIDEFSGLVLLATDRACPSKLELADVAPAAGSWVMSSAAWGTEKPLVSLGIVSATERTVIGVNYPPLLQCDVRISDTSGGGAVVDKHCRLVGVMVAADASDQRRGWAYAVPAAHVARLMRAQANNAEESVIVLKRRRPVVGVALDGDENGVFVQRVYAGGPAEKAGIKVGDQIIATDGVKIRSVYQAAMPTFRKQPGDLLTLRIQRDEKEQDIPVVLGGGLELAAAPLDFLGGIVQPKVSISSDKKGSYSLGHGRANKDLATTAEPEAKIPAEKTAERQSLLEKTVERYLNTIEAQQAEIEALKAELAKQKKK